MAREMGSLGVDSKVLFLAVGMGDGQWGSDCGQECSPTSWFAGSYQDLERRLARGISWHSHMPEQLSIE